MDSGKDGAYRVSGNSRTIFTFQDNFLLPLILEITVIISLIQVLQIHTAVYTYVDFVINENFDLLC